MGRVRRWGRRAGLFVFAVVAVLASVTPAHAQPGPIQLSPTHGPVGATVTITGTGLLTTTAVSFGSVPAHFDRVSDERVDAVVPPDAPTDLVHVDTLDGSVSSDAPFVVQPNIVMILTDDQRWDTLSYMPTVESELVAHGVTFSNAFVENPLCCPSRASFLTGQDSHTTGVYANDGDFGGFAAFDDTSTIATSLHDAGYYTFFTGKYLNQYWDTGGLYMPPGWDRWRAFASIAPYFDYDVSLNGTAVESYGSDPSDYSTDVIAGYADDVIRNASSQQPLLLWIAPFAPHTPFTPAPRDAGTLPGLDPWRPPSYNEPNMLDKPAYMQAHPSLSVDEQARIDGVREEQLEALGAVDDAVGTIVDDLAATGRLGDTIIIYASDNGFLWGEHRLDGKTVPYEESIRIPFVLRWDRLANVPRTDTSLVQNVDVVPTLLEAAGAGGGGFDGMSLMPLLTERSTKWRSHMLIEHSGSGPPDYCGDRTPNDILIHYATGEEEYYRVGRADPYELTNRISKPKFQRRIGNLRSKLRTMCSPLPPNMPAF